MALALMLAAALAGTFLPGRGARGGAPRSADARARIGLVFDVGGRGDKSFNDAAYAGILRAQRELGAEIAFLEPTGSEDREAALRLFAAQGFDLVIGVGFIFSNDIAAAARAYPGVRFACVDYASFGKAVPANLAGLSFREEEGSFLVGAAAGTLSKTGHVGFVGGMQGPLIRKFEVGYTQGVHQVCPACVVHVGYIGPTPDAFRDPSKGKALAISQVGAGADVLFHAAGASGHGVFEGAKEGGARAIGVDSDQYDELPGTVVTSMIKRADVSVFEVAREVVTGQFRGGMRELGLRDGAIDWVHEGAHAAGISEATRRQVAELAGRVVRGDIVVARE